MSMSGRKRRAETLIINNDDEEAEPTQQEGEEQGGCQMTSPYSIPELSTTILQDILSRLSIKTLFNCRCDCKDWLPLISDPDFVKLHLSRSQVSLLLKPFTCVRNSRRLHLVDLKIAPFIRPRNALMKFTTKINLPKDPKIAFNIVNSCNGLLCLCDSIIYDPIYIWNPILREYITLPKCPSGTKCGDRSSAFSFVPKTNQYKVIRLLRRMKFDPITNSSSYGGYEEAEIYTLGEGSWKSIGKTPYSIIENRSFNAFMERFIGLLSAAVARTSFVVLNEQFRLFLNLRSSVYLRKVLRIICVWECCKIVYLSVILSTLSMLQYG